jgi:MFS family permease
MNTTVASAATPASTPASAASEHGKPSGAAIDTAEFKLGWRILILAILGVGINIPLQQAHGWERGQMQTAISFLFAGAVASAQLAGWLNLRYGMRTVTLVSLVCLSLVFLAMTQMGSSIVWLYVMFIALPLASLGTMQVTWTHLVNLWFVRNRGLALALVLSGTGLAAALLPSAVTWAVGRWNWQAAFVLLALLPVCLALPLALRWMAEPGQRGGAAVDATKLAEAAAQRRQGLSFREGIVTGRFWAMNLGLSLVVASVVAMVTNTVPLLRDKGLSAAEASSIFGAFGVSLIAGRVVVGYLVDRLWAPGVAAVALSIPALGCWLLLQAGATDTTMLVIAAMMLGVGAGAEFDVAAYLVARYVGMRDYGRLFGVHLGLITLASALAPMLAGMLYRNAGSYTPVLTVCGFSFLIGALVLLPLGRYPRFAERPADAAPTA